MTAARARARYAAFLRGVMPTNASMPDLKRAFEAAGFTDVSTILSSGNLVFTAPPAPEPSLERRAEAAMARHLARSFPAVVRSLAALRRMLAADPYAAFALAPRAKRVVTFLREFPAKAPALPVEAEGARILHRDGREVFSAYVPGGRGPVFMTLIEKTFGKNATTRTWDTIRRVADAGGGTGAISGRAAPSRRRARRRGGPGPRSGRAHSAARTGRSRPRG